MATKLEKAIRREIDIDGETYTVSLGPDGVRLTRKRFRSGVGLSWKALLALASRHAPPTEPGETT